MVAIEEVMENTAWVVRKTRPTAGYLDTWWMFMYIKEYNQNCMRFK